MGLSVRSALLGAALIAAFLLAALTHAERAAASHGRGSNLSWQQTAPDTADFRNRNVFRRSAYAGTASDGRPAVGDVVLAGESISAMQLFYGDPGGISGGLFMRVTQINTAEDWLVADALDPADKDDREITHRYGTPGPWTAGIDHCCLLNNLYNGAAGNWQLRSLVDLAKTTGSPFASVPPVVTIPNTGVQRIPVGGAHRGGLKLRYRLHPVVRPSFAQLAIDPDTGVISWKTDGMPLRLYYLSVLIDALDVSGNPVSSSQIDFVVQLVVPGANRPPVWDDPTPAEGERIEVQANETVTLPLRASDPDSGDAVNMDRVEIPDGASWRATDGNPAEGAFHWKPRRDQTGDHLVMFSAEEDRASGLEAPARAFTIHVPENTPPHADAGPDRESVEGDTVTLDGSGSSDPDGDSLRHTWTRTGGTGPAAVLSSPSAVRPSFETLDDGDSTFRLGVDDGHGEAVTDEVSTTTRNLPPAVTAPDVEAKQGGATVLAADISDPGVLDTHTATVNWGDGSEPEQASVSQGAGWASIVAAHRYTELGTYHATVTVADDDGGGASTSADVTVVEPPAPAGMWANSTSASAAFDWSGSNNRITGLIHTNGGLKITGSENTVTGAPAEYAGKLQLGGGNVFDPAPVKTDAKAMPVAYNVADYAPGGSVAQAAGGAFFDKSEHCRDHGAWVVSTPGTQLASGVYYVPCRVELSGAGVGGEVTIASTGTIAASGSNLNLRPHADGLLLLTSKASNNTLHVSGADSTFKGVWAAPNGEVHVAGERHSISGGVFADRIKLTGSYHEFVAESDSDPVAEAAPITTLVPTPKLDLGVSQASAVPGDDLRYEAKLTNAGATLVASGLVGAENTGTAGATVEYLSYTLEYLDAELDTWVPVAGLDAGRLGYVPREPAVVRTGASLVTHAMPSPGVTYGSDAGRVLGTELGANSLAAWGYQARIALTPEQVELLYDETRVTDVRSRVHLEYAPGTAPVRSLGEIGADFGATLRAESKDVTDAHVTFAPPTGDHERLDPSNEPALARLAPGQSATIARDYALPAVPERGFTEESDGYLARLLAADGAAIRSTARADTGSAIGRLYVPQSRATTTQRVPALRLDKTGPDVLDAGASADYDLALANDGSAPASALVVDDAIVGGGFAEVSGAPSALEPGEAATAHSEHRLPAVGAGSVTDTGTAKWKDANGNEYGPVEDSFTTEVQSPAKLRATKTATLAVDADGNELPTAGDTLEYEVRITNREVGSASAVKFSDTPDQSAPLVPGSVTTTHGSVTSNSGSVGVDVGTLGGNAEATIRFRAQIASPLDGSVQAVQNQGLVKHSGGPDLLTDDPSAAGALDPTITAIHVAAPRIEGEKTATVAVDADEDGQPSPGDTLEYEVVLRNRGDLEATGVTVFDSPGANTRLVTGSVEVPGGSVLVGNATGERRVLAHVDRIEIGGEAVVRFRAAIDEALSAGVASVANQAFFYSNETSTTRSDDPAQDGDLDPTVTALSLPPRLEATKADTLTVDADGNGKASPGDTIRYDVRVRNTSGSTATGVRLVDTVDANTVPVPGSVQASQGTGSVSGGTVTAELGSVAVGAEASASFEVQVRNELPAGVYEVANQGRIESAERRPLRTDDPDVAGSVDPTVTPVVRTDGPAPELVATKTDTLAVDADGDRTVTPGDTLSYEVKVSNVGEGSARDVRLTDTPDVNAPLLPGSVQAAGYTVERGNGAEDRDIAVGLGSIAPGTSATLTFQAKVREDIAPGIDAVRNQGSVTSLEVAPVLTQDPDGATPGGATETPVNPPPRKAPAIAGFGPADGTAVTEPTPITGTLAPPAGQAIESWCVTATLVGGEAERRLDCGTGAPTSETLATFDPTVLPNGAYEVTVTATASGGGELTKTLTLSVEGQLKLGRYTTTYRDLAIPIHSLPIEILRTYDSFDKEKGDFGVGWNVEIANMRVQVNRPLGRSGWSFQGRNCRTLLGAPLCEGTEFKDLSSHFVTIVWPDGREEVFDFKPTSSSAGVYFDANVNFEPRRGVTSKLEPLEGGQVLQYWGDGNLYQDDGQTLYDPRRFKLTTKDGKVMTVSVAKGLERIEDPRGNNLTIDEDGVHSSTGKSIVFTRDDEDRITKILGPSGETLTYSYGASGDLGSVTNARGKTNTFRYDGDHNIIASNSPAGDAFRTLNYDGDGRLTSMVDGEGNVTEIDSDAGARQQIITPPGGALTRISSHDEWGQVTSVQELADGKSRTVRYEYDEVGNRTRTVDPLGNDVSVGYNDDGDIVSVRDELGATTEYRYNEAGLLTEVVEPSGPGVRVAYNEFGEPVEIDRGGGRVISLDYDSQGRLWRRTNPGGGVSVTTHDASGNPLTVEEDGRVVQYTWDASNRMASVMDPRGARSTFTYDGEGNLVTFNQPLGYRLTYGYDDAGRQTSETDPAGKSRTVTFDDAGRVVETKDRNDGVTKFHYDGAGRLSRKDLPDGTAVTHGYDGFGRLNEARNSDAVTSLVHDAGDRVTSVTTAGPAGSSYPTTTIDYEYDDAGNPTSISGPGGTSRYRYGGTDGQLEEITDVDGGAFRFERDELDRPSRLVRPNGVVSATSWDTADEVRDIVHTNGAGAVVDEAHYQHNVLGLTTGVTDGYGQHTFGYDSRGYLQSASHPGGQPSESYFYDLNGNRSSQGSHYDQAGRLIDDNSHAFTYDAEGNTLSRTEESALAPKTTFRWGAEGELRSVVEPNSDETTYRYDAFGRRIEVRGPRGTRRFAYGLDDNVLVEFDGQNGLTARHTFEPGQLDRPLSTHRSGGPVYPLIDGGGNVTALTDRAGTAVERFRYGTYGQPIGTTATTSYQFTFAGREWDPESRTYFMRARNYDPVRGRFLSEDPAATTNAYAYGLNSPLEFTDPTGRWTKAELEASTSVQFSLRERMSIAFTLKYIAVTRYLQGVAQLVPRALTIVKNQLATTASRAVGAVKQATINTVRAVWSGTRAVISRATDLLKSGALRTTDAARKLLVWVNSNAAKQEILRKILEEIAKRSDDIIRNWPF